MKINIILFGQLTDITGTDAFIVENVVDTNSLVATLHETYPSIDQFEICDRGKQKCYFGKYTSYQ